VPYFRPSCVVDLKVKFDEELTTLDGGKLITNEEALKLAPVVTTAMAAGIPLMVQVAEEEAQVKPSWVMSRVPKMLSLEKPGYRQASKFSMELDFRELPIDPRTVRAASVEIHLGTVNDDDFSDGFFGSGKDALGHQKSILQTRGFGGGPNAETLKLVGIVDEWEVEHSDKGSTVMLQGRDMRGVLLDTPIGPQEVKDIQLLGEIQWAKPIDEVVAQILAFNPHFEEMRVIVNEADWPDETLPSPGFPGVIPRVKKGARGKKKEGKQAPPAGSSNLNFWDLIVRACYLCGAIPYMTGPHLAIRPSSTVFDKLRGPLDPDQNPTPFAEGEERKWDAEANASIWPYLRTRRVVYGRDTLSVRMSRKFVGWRKPKIIRAISVTTEKTTDPTGAATAGGKFLRVGIWPPQPEGDAAKEKARKTGVAPGGKPKEEIVNVPVHGISDVERLTLIARSVYEEMGRGEMGGEVQTLNLASFGGDNSDPDLLRLEPGDGIEFMVDTQAIKTGIGPVVSTYTDSERRSFDAQVTEIMKYIPDRNLARVIVATARGEVTELQNFFRVQNVKFAWDADSGVKINFDFQNYVVARAQVGDASAKAGEAKAIAVGKTSGEKGPRSMGNL
jgi:hypothetical protein